MQTAALHVALDTALLASLHPKRVYQTYPENANNSECTYLHIDTTGRM